MRGDRKHPAGRIGKRLSLKVEDLMVRGGALAGCGPKEKLVDALVELSDKKLGCIMIIDDERHLLGIFTDGDLRRALQKHAAKALDLAIDEIMTKNPRTIAPKALAFDAMKEMEANQKGAITSLAVVEKEKLIGIIRLHDIVQSGL